MNIEQLGINHLQSISMGIKVPILIKAELTLKLKNSPFAYADRGTVKGDKTTSVETFTKTT